MPLKTVQIIAGLGAAIAFLLAFMVTGTVLASLLFALIGTTLLACLIYAVSCTLFGRPHRDPHLQNGPHRPAGPPVA